MRQYITKLHLKHNNLLSCHHFWGSFLDVSIIIVLTLVGGLFVFGWRNLTYPIRYHVEQCEDYVTGNSLLRQDVSVAARRGTRTVHVAIPYVTTLCGDTVFGRLDDLERATDDQQMITYYRYSDSFSKNIILCNVNAYQPWLGFLILLGFFILLAYVVFIMIGLATIPEKAKTVQNRSQEKKHPVWNIIYNSIVAIIIIMTTVAYLISMNVLFASFFI